MDMNMYGHRNLVDCTLFCVHYTFIVPWDNMKMCLHEMKNFRTKMNQFTVEKQLCDNKILCSYNYSCI